MSKTVMTDKSIGISCPPHGRKKAVSSGGTTDKNGGKKGIQMEFLKEILGEDLYNQFVEKVNAHNGNESNKDKQIKLENLNSGKYVSKLKYEDLETQLAGRQSELDTANGLIAELKKGNKGNEELQGKVTQYEQTIANLQAQFHEEKVKNAIKVSLLSEKAVDVDYLTYKLNEKLKEKGESLELDENDNIKGWEDKLSGLKTQFPTMFESSQRKIIEENRLPEGDKRNDTITKEAFAKMGYKSRVELKESNPELYSKLTN